MDRQISHYSSSQRILLVGEGSFSTCLARAFGSATNMVATSRESKGHSPRLREKDFQLIQKHRTLLTEFFGSACMMLNYRGEIHVTTRDDYPYRRWNVKQLAKDAGLFLDEKVLFKKSDYPGYRNKRGRRIKGNKTFRLRKSCTFKFALQEDYCTHDDADDEVYLCL